MIVVGCVVSVNYGRKLDIALRAAFSTLQHAFVVTTPEDAVTLATCEAWGDRVTVLHHDFSHQGAAFDKGCAMRKAQLAAHARFPNAYYLVMDADAVLPPDAAAVLAAAALLPDTLYGAASRWDVRSLSALRAGRHDPSPDPVGDRFIGYFQLYKQHSRGQPQPLYAHSRSAAECDNVFRSLFPKLVTLPLQVLHLGVRGRNWQGIKKEDFDFDS